MKIKLVLILVFLFALTKLHAQLCQGSLGDPIVNITFGAGANPGPALSAAGTGYQYVPGDCPNDGSYTVRNNSYGCFGNSWHNIAADHTGNANGYFMLVNASIQPSAFYLDTVRGLCSNSTYEFAAWIMNVTNPQSCSGNAIQPNLTFRIEKTDGSLLQSYNTNNISVLPLATWMQYGFFFTTPVGIPDIVLRILNNATGGCGNDIALDDITFRPCGPLLIPSIATQSSNTVSLCEDMQGSYNFSCIVSGGFTNPSYQWQKSTNNGPWIDIAGETTTSFATNFAAGTAVGTYAFRLSVAETGNMGSAQCRIASAPLTIKVNANPVTTATNNGPSCKGDQVLLTATGGAMYQWTGPNAFTGSGSPVSINDIQPIQEGKYYVVVSSSEGCEHLDSTIIALKPSPTAIVGFTDAKICMGDSIMLSVSGGDSYQWIPGSGLSLATASTPHASPGSSLQYAAIVSNSLNCTDTAYVNITVLEAPHADAGPDQTLILNQRQVELSATAHGNNINYYWTPSPYLSNNISLQSMATPPVSTAFIFNVSSFDGCGNDSDTMQVFVYNDVFIPNSFTPNGDGKNDSWYITALNAFRNYELSVFNRYGQRLFYLKNENKPWDGTFDNKRLPIGAYVYVLDLKTAMQPLKGTVMILR